MIVCRERAVEMLERGCGYGLTAKRLGVSAETVREWQKMYRVIGRGGRCHQRVRRNSPSECASSRRRWRTQKTIALKAQRRPQTGTKP